MNNNSLKRLRHHPKVLWIFAIILLLVVLVAVWRYYQHFLNNQRQRIAGTVPVTVAIARSMAVPVYLPALGSVTSTYNVSVRTQVNGRLLSVNFREGQAVKAGQLLAEIDPRPFQAQVLQFSGQLERDKALLANAKVDLKRYKVLYPLGAVAKQTYDTQKALVQQLEGTIKADQGQLDTARINLGYCYIDSPINGRIGLRLVDAGNFVQTSDQNGIAVVNTVQPITVIFSIPEDDVPEVLQQLRAGKQLQVKAYDRNSQQLLAVGTLLTIDNQIDPTTGTVKLRARFNNENDTLFPNQFVNIKLLVKTLYQATVVPNTAIQQGSQGDYVFLLNNNQTVTIKPVKVGISYHTDTVIVEGLTPGQKIIKTGTDKLVDGSKVVVMPAIPRAKSEDLLLPIPQKSLH